MPPLCLVATSSADGSCDVSLKGGPIGFTLVLDNTTIAIPERPGNRRADGFRNLLTNPHVGLIYLIPGRGDTLRINGRARLVCEASCFEQMVVKGHRPLLALIVEIDEVFYHCSKTFLRSDLWQPATWAPDEVPTRAQIVQRLDRPERRWRICNNTTAPPTPPISTRRTKPHPPWRQGGAHCGFEPQKR